MKTKLFTALLILTLMPACLWAAEKKLPDMQEILPAVSGVEKADNGAYSYLEAFNEIKLGKTAFSMKNSQIDLQGADAERLLYVNEKVFDSVKSGNARKTVRFDLDYQKGLFQDEPGLKQFLNVVYLHSLKASNPKTGERDRLMAVTQGLLFIDRFLNGISYKDGRLLTKQSDAGLMALEIMVPALKSLKEPPNDIRKLVDTLKNRYEDNWLSKTFETDYICGREVYRQLTAGVTKISEVADPSSPLYRKSVSQYDDKNFLNADRQAYDSFMTDAIRKMLAGQIEDIDVSGIENSPYLIAKTLCYTSPTPQQRTERRKYIFASLSGIGL